MITSRMPVELVTTAIMHVAVVRASHQNRAALTGNAHVGLVNPKR